MRKIHFVAIGANLPGPGGLSPQAGCEQAASQMMAMPGARAVCRSRWFSSAAVPDPTQPRYINGIVRLEGEWQPGFLLTWLQAAEIASGRTRTVPNAARTLDLDIIDMDGLVRDAPDPVLPHPRAHLRAFVLLPLRDVAPCWVHPRSRVPVAELIAALPPQDIYPV